MTAWLLFAAGVVLGVAARWVFLKVIPYKRCPLCKGRGLCFRCQYTGKVLRAGAGLVHPELRRK